MWADPVDNETGKLDGLAKKNDTRGCSYFFGYELSKQFLQKNGLLSVIRAHEAQANGFKMYHWGGTKQFPTVITIFSAPNYCDFYNNKGAVIKFKVLFYLFRTTLSIFNNFCKVSILTYCQISWIFSNGPFHLSLRKLLKCFIIWSSQTENMTKTKFFRNSSKRRT
jgi:phage-related holin